MKIEIPEKRESSILIGEATDDDRNIFPWAIELEDEWHWGGTICDLEEAIFFENRAGEIVKKPDGIDAVIAYKPFYLIMARSADAVLQYVLENPHYYGLAPANQSTFGDIAEIVRPKTSGVMVDPSIMQMPDEPKGPIWSLPWNIAKDTAVRTFLPFKDAPYRKSKRDEGKE